MNPTYKLFINGKKMIGPLNRLRSIAENSCHPYEIYAYYASIMEEKFEGCKLTVQDIMEAVRLRTRGYGYHTIARKFSINAKTLTKIIRPLVEEERLKIKPNIHESI